MGACGREYGLAYPHAYLLAQRASTRNGQGKMTNTRQHKVGPAGTTPRSSAPGPRQPVANTRPAYGKGRGGRSPDPPRQGRGNRHRASSRQQGRGNRPQAPRRTRTIVMWVLLALLSVVLVQFFSRDRSDGMEIGYSTFRDHLANGNILNVTILEKTIVGEFRNGVSTPVPGGRESMETRFKVEIPFEDTELIDELVRHERNHHRTAEVEPLVCAPGHLAAAAPHHRPCGSSSSGRCRAARRDSSPWGRARPG